MSTTAASAHPRAGASARGHRRDIQGLRAIAVLLVIVYHADLPIPGGFMGVDVFFTISGYVITAMLLREFADSGSVRLGHFFRRRVQRLWPALSLVVLVTILGSVLWQSATVAHDVTVPTGIGAVLLSANFVIYSITGGYFDVSADLNPLLHTWSLSVEEQFYLVFPALLLLSLRSRRAATMRLDRVLMVLSVVGIASFALSLYLSVHAPLQTWGLERAADFGFYSSLTRAWEFVLGAVLAVVHARTARLDDWIRRLRAAGPIALAGVATIAAAAIWGSDTAAFPGWLALAPTLGTVALIAAGRSDDQNLATRLLSTQPMVLVGDWSYSLYLWHWPFIVLLGVAYPDRIDPVTAAALSVPAALASYYLVEQPIRGARLDRRRSTAALMAVCVAAPVLVGVVVQRGEQPASVSALNDLLPHADTARQCDLPVALADRDLSQCTWAGKPGEPPIYLLGDSQGGQLAEAAIGAGRTLGREVVLATQSACPPALVSVTHNGAHNVECQLYTESMTPWLGARPAGTVVLAMSDIYVVDAGWTLTGPDGRVASTTEDKQEVLEAGMTALVEAVQEAGSDVVLVRPIPKFWTVGDDGRVVFWDPRSCSPDDVETASSACGPSASLDDVAEQHVWADPAVSRIARATGARVLDLTEHLCVGQSCTTAEAGRWLYRDGGHVSVPVSKRLAQPLAEVLRAGD